MDAPIDWNLQVYDAGGNFQRKYDRIYECGCNIWERCKKRAYAKRNTNGDGGFLEIPRPHCGICLFSFDVKLRVDGVEVFAVQMILYDP